MQFAENRRFESVKLLEVFIVSLDTMSNKPDNLLHKYDLVTKHCKKYGSSLTTFV